jgi:hypothetical protein
VHKFPLVNKIIVNIQSVWPANSFIFIFFSEFHINILASLDALAKCFSSHFTRAITHKI